MSQHTVTNPLLKLAHEYGTLKSKYERSTRLFIHNQVKPMPDANFWPLVTSLSDAIALSQRSRAKDPKPTINEFVRGHLYDSKHGMAAEWIGFVTEQERNINNLSWANKRLSAWVMLASFTRTYTSKSNFINRTCARFTDIDRSDDGLHDLADSLVLAGEMVNQLGKGINDMAKLTEATAEHPLSKFMLYGENYIEMALSDALIEFGPGIASPFFPKEDDPLR